MTYPRNTSLWVLYRSVHSHTSVPHVAYGTCCAPAGLRTCFLYPAHPLQFNNIHRCANICDVADVCVSYLCRFLYNSCYLLGLFVGPKQAESNKAHTICYYSLYVWLYVEVYALMCY